MKAPSTTYVLVHGAWHGGWCWRRVADRLTAAGHRVFCPTLTGLGERAHLLTREVNLGTHIADVVGLLEAEELNEVVLVGHSYGGIVITGVAARAKPRLRQLVYLDSAIVEDGATWASIGLPEVVAERRKAAQESSGGVSLPVPKAEVFGLRRPEEIAWVQRRLTPHPFGGFEQTMRWGGPVGNSLPKVYVDCTEPAYAGLTPVKERYRGKPGWPFVEIRTGHDAMVSAPEETAKLLLGFS
ncbi:MAG TPA: alpha/beta fold hydrolase [Burkholderiales bacterium]|nr:alpha/beta fold hydrolase [Burkholderiales bacterium]